MVCLIVIGMSLLMVIYVLQIFVLFAMFLNGDLYGYIDTKKDFKRWLAPWTLYISGYTHLINAIKTNYKELRD